MSRMGFLSGMGAATVLAAANLLTKASNAFDPGMPTLTVDPDVKAWADRVAKLTPAQAHVFKALRHSGLTREQAYARASAIDPELTMEDLQEAAKRRLSEENPDFARAEEKRRRKGEKRRRDAERSAK